MRVGLDTNAVFTGHTGARTYFLDLLTELLQLVREDDELLIFRSSEDQPEPLAWLMRHDQLHDVSAPFKGRSGDLWRNLSFPAVERLATGPDAQRLGALDVCHSIHPPIMPSRAQRRILTVHNLEAAVDRLPSSLRRSMSQADVVVVLSALMRDRLVQLLKAEKPEVAGSIGSRLEVIQPGVNARYVAPPKPSEVEALCQEYPFLQEPYLLVEGGAAELGRSIPFLLDAYSRAQTLDGSLPPLVILAAQPGDSQHIADLVKQTHEDNRILVLEDLDTEALPALYLGAEFLLYPAFDYAFGTAVLEAAATGIPSVIGQRCGVFEVIGDGALVPADDSLDAWAEAIARFHDDPRDRGERSRRCQERARRQDWSQAADQHWAAYSD